MPNGVPTFDKFNDNRKEAYLDALRRGVGRTRAAKAAGVHRSLIALYRRKFPEFATLENEAEDEATDEVENALWKSATDGNVTACQVWLYNRRSDRWKDQRNREHPTSESDGLDDQKRISRIRELVDRAISRCAVEANGVGEAGVGSADEQAG